MAVRGVEDAAPYVLHVSKCLPGAGPFVGQNDGRQPAELAHSCGSMPHWGIDRCATPQQRASAPTEWVVEEILAPEGSIGEEAKSVKKRAALLHVLAFCFFDLLFGVLRGEQPLSRAPRLGSSGTFLLLFWSQKRRNGGDCPLKKALPQGRQGRSGAKILPTIPYLCIIKLTENPSKGATK